MRKTLIGLVALGAFALAVPATAHTGPSPKSYTFEGAIPCATVCSYWVDNGFTPCENPFPPGAHIDKTTPGAPTPPAGKIVVLEATLDSTIDWDGFLCANTSARTELAQMANILGDPCDNIIGPNNLVPVGCHEDGSTPVTAGQTVIFKAYNWSDTAPANGKTWFTIV